MLMLSGRRHRARKYDVVGVAKMIVVTRQYMFPPSYRLWHHVFPVLP